MVPKDKSVSRRRALKTLGASITGIAFAGCSQDGSNSEGSTETDTTGTTAGSSGDGQDAVSLTYAHPWPEPQHTTQDWILPFINKVEEYSDTDVTIEHQPAGQLASGGEYLSLVQDGVVELAQTGPAYHPGQIPLSLVTDLPGQFTDNVAAQKTAYDITRNYIQGENYDSLGVEAIGVNLEAPFTPGHWTDEPIVQREDWDGVSIRSSGGVVSSVIEQLGGSPVNIGPSDVYSAAERGTIDGALFAINTFDSWDLDEFITHVPTNINLGSFGAVTIINQEVYDGLPEDVRNAMTTASEELNTEYGEAQMSHRAEARETYSDAVYEVPQEDKQNWTEVMDAAKQDWADTMAERDEPGQEVLDRWNELYDQYS